MAFRWLEDDDIDDIGTDDVGYERPPVEEAPTVLADPPSMKELLTSAIEYLDVDQRRRRLRELSYDEYLQTDHWQATRRATLERFGYRCVGCGAQKDLNVHHRTYRNVGAEDASDLVVFCRTCHLAEHDKDEATDDPAIGVRAEVDPFSK